MSDLRKRMGMTCLGVLLSSAVLTPAIHAEGRGPAPVVFAGEGGGAAPERLAGGPLDLRPGAHPVKFTAPALSNSSGNNISVSPRRDGWSQPYAGPPYQVNGKWFVPMHEPDYDEVGIASWYGPGFNGEVASSGETFDQDALTAAHPTLPIPSVVRVTNLENNRSVLVRLNDRGPYVDDRIIDLSRGTADALDVRRNGTAKVRVQYVGPAPSDPGTVLTERMFAGGSAAPIAASAVAPETRNVWTTELPPAAGMPERPLAQASDQGVARPDEVLAERVGSVSAPRIKGGYALQVGSFSDLSNAHKALSALEQHGQGYVASAVVNGGQFYRVMLGPWPTEADAERMKVTLASAGKQTLLVNLQ